MRPSTTILGKIERVLMAPGWAYCTWHFFPLMPPRPQGRPAASDPTKKPLQGTHR